MTTEALAFGGCHAVVVMAHHTVIVRTVDIAGYVSLLRLVAAHCLDNGFLFAHVIKIPRRTDLQDKDL